MNFKKITFLQFSVTLFVKKMQNFNLMKSTENTYNSLSDIVQTPHTTLTSISHPVTAGSVSTAFFHEFLKTNLMYLRIHVYFNYASTYRWHTNTAYSYSYHEWFISIRLFLIKIVIAQKMKKEPSYEFLLWCPSGICTWAKFVHLSY